MASARRVQRTTLLVRGEDQTSPGTAISLVGDAARIETAGGASDDVALLLGAAAGSWDSIGELYLRHRDASVAVAVSVLADPAEAEDVMHEAFVDLPRMARSYDPRRGQPAQWLYRSVRNRAIDHLRRRSRWARRMASSVDGPDALLATAISGEASPARTAESDEFLDLITRLEPRHAHLIRLAFLEGWSHTAIAELTGLPLGTVKTRIRRSLQQLRQLLAAVDAAPISAPGPVPAGPDEANVVAFTGDRTFGDALVHEAIGLTHVDVRAHIPAHPGTAPDAAVLDFQADARTMYESLSRLDDVGWDRVPVLVRITGQDAPLAMSGRLAPTLVTGPDSADLQLNAAVPALLSASQDADVRRIGTERLLQSDDSAVVAGDSLGRVTGASPAAAAVLGRTPRQLEGSYITELVGMPARWTERWWQYLATSGWWTGRMLMRHPARALTPVETVAWMERESGFVGISTAIH